MKTYTEEEVKNMLRQAWFAGWYTSQHNPSPNNQAARDSEEILNGSKDS